MPKYTLQQIRDVARSKDERLENKTKYPDSWIDSKIDSAFETAESGRQVFVAEDSIDLQPYINDNVEKFLYETNEQAHKITDIVSNFPNHVKTRINNDNTVNVELDLDALRDKEVTMTFKYYYIPTSDFEEIFMQPEVYHYFRHCLYVGLYGSLRDKENELYHQAQVDRFIKEGSFGIQNDFDEFIPLKSNFYGIGNNTWE